MKYTFCEKLMWFALAGPSFKYLESREQSVSKKKAKEIFRQKQMGSTIAPLLYLAAIKGNGRISK